MTYFPIFSFILQFIFEQQNVKKEGNIGHIARCRRAITSVLLAQKKNLAGYSKSDIK